MSRYECTDKSVVPLKLFGERVSEASFGGFHAMHNNILGRRLKDARPSMIIVNPIALNDTRLMTHVIHALCVGEGYRKDRVTRDHFYEGTKRWGKITEDFDIRERNKYYVHGIHPGDYVYLKTPFILNQGTWFSFPEEWMDIDQVREWVHSFHEDDVQRTLLQDTESGLMVSGVQVKLYIVGADEAIGILELEEGETEEAIIFGIRRGDMMSAQ